MIKFQCFVFMIVVYGLSIIEQFGQILLKFFFFLNQLQIFHLIFYQYLNFLLQLIFSSYDGMCFISLLFNAFLFRKIQMQKGFKQLFWFDRSVHSVITWLILIYMADGPRKIGNNIIMLDPQRKQNIFTSRASYQLREIQHTCREVVSMSKVLNTLSFEIGSSQVNCKKIQFFKSEIKDKLKQFAGSVDEIYKILDKKIQLILLEVKKRESKEEKGKAQNGCNKCKGLLIKGNGQCQKLTNSQSERIFSDTLNPRVTHLEAKIIQYQAIQTKLKSKIGELTSKNEALLQEFNRLSTASNKKINELTSKISNKDVFNSDYQKVNYSPLKSGRDAQIPTYNIPPLRPKKSNALNFQTQQFSYQLSNEPSYISQPHAIDDKPHFLSFGCMPSRTTKTTNNILEKSNVSEQYERFDRNDKNRRFDILLNKLRDSQQQSTDGSHSEEMRVMNEQIGSVFSHNVVQRYQI